jgi:hypothetical protein
MVEDINPFQYILTRHIIGGKYKKWIVILQEIDLDFVSVKYKKLLVFYDLISDFPLLDEDIFMTIHSWMNIFSLSPFQTHSMETF